LPPVNSAEALRFWLIAIRYTPVSLALTFGPFLIVAVTLGVVGLLMTLRGRHWRVTLIIALLCVGELAVLMSRGMNEVRYYWPEVSLRFATLPFGLLAAAGAVTISRISFWRPALMTLLMFLTS